MKKKPRMKQALTTAPKKGKVKSFGHEMGGMFGMSPKKPEPDMKPRTRGSEQSARRARLTNRII